MGFLLDMFDDPNAMRSLMGDLSFGSQSPAAPGQGGIGSDYVGGGPMPPAPPMPPGQGGIGSDYASTANQPPPPGADPMLNGGLPGIAFWRAAAGHRSVSYRRFWTGRRSNAAGRSASS